MIAILNVLISSAGRRVALVEILRSELRSLNLPNRLIATDMSPLAPACYVADEQVRVPQVGDPNFAAVMMGICRDHRIGLIIPTIDPELHVFATMREDLASAGMLVIASGPRTVALSADKRLTFPWLTAHAIPTVEQWDFSEADRIADKLLYPVIVKPARGSASAGVRRIGSPSELRAVVGDDLIVQSLAPGDEYTVDVWVDRAGEPRCAVPRRRIEVRAGEVSKGVTEARGDVMAVAQAVARTLPDAFGPITVQVFGTEGGEVRVIEVNPRLGGGFPLANEAGARYLRWAIQESLGRPYEPPHFEWRDGLTMLRYDDAVFLPRSDMAL
jgi:carbamoyl-phosphate synthase large subunit